MSQALTQAARVRPPFDVGANDFNARKFTAGVAGTHKINAIPASWAGKIVRVYVFGLSAATDTLHYGFSKSSTAEVDNAVAATDAGASTKVGGVLSNNQAADHRMPTKQDSESIYFVRETSAAAGTVVLFLASD